MVKCSSCGKDFQTKTVQTGDEQAMKSFTGTLSENCPHCGALNTYDSNAMFWRQAA